ncbi:MAG: hypothetical protein ACOY0T_12330 [Myxococcota bacterium]
MNGLAASAYGVFALVFALVAAIVWGSAVASRNLGGSAIERRRAVISTAGGLVVWLAVTGMVGELPFMRNYDALPPPMFRVFVPSLTAAMLVVFSRVGARVVDGLGFAPLVALQAFRFPLELLLVYGFHAEGKAPVQMTIQGQNFDIVSGISAIVLAGMLVLRGERQVSRALIWVWNALGTALLLNIVVLSVLSMPGPLRYFQNEPANTFVFRWPYIWVPLFFVIVAAFGHALVFRKLVRTGAARECTGTAARTEVAERATAQTTLSSKV